MRRGRCNKTEDKRSITYRFLAAAAHSHLLIRHKHSFALLVLDHLAPSASLSIHPWSSDQYRHTVRAIQPHFQEPLFHFPRRWQVRPLFFIDAEDPESRESVPAPGHVTPRARPQSLKPSLMASNGLADAYEPMIGVESLNSDLIAEIDGPVASSPPETQNLPLPVWTAVAPIDPVHVMVESVTPVHTRVFCAAIRRSLAKSTVPPGGISKRPHCEAHRGIFPEGAAAPWHALAPSAMTRSQPAKGAAQPGEMATALRPRPLPHRCVAVHRLIGCQSPSLTRQRSRTAGPGGPGLVRVPSPRQQGSRTLYTHRGQTIHLCG